MVAHNSIQALLLERLSFRSVLVIRQVTTYFPARSFMGGIQL